MKRQPHDGKEKREREKKKSRTLFRYYLSYRVAFQFSYIPVFFVNSTHTTPSVLYSIGLLPVAFSSFDVPIKKKGEGRSAEFVFLVSLPSSHLEVDFLFFEIFLTCGWVHIFILNDISSNKIR
jgi:hypothetical protein